MTTRQAEAGRVCLGWLYPSSLSTYGDRGNVIALVQRAAWRGLEPRVVRIEADSDIPDDVDIFFIGGGQDSAQAHVSAALTGRHRTGLLAGLDGGASLLAICGGYQLLGHEFVTAEGRVLPGMGVFDVVTQGAPDRLVGNVRLATRFGPVVGFENHSGRTYLGAEAEPLGTVEHGHGNNGADGTEGVIRGRAIGSYLHGPVLPRNPSLADWLLIQGIRRREPHAELQPLPDLRHLLADGPRGELVHDQEAAARHHVRGVG